MHFDDLLDLQYRFPDDENISKRKLDSVGSYIIIIKLGPMGDYPDLLEMTPDKIKIIECVNGIGAY